MPVELEPLEFGGNVYPPEDPSPRARIDISRTVAGYALRLRTRAAFTGPCVRCLGEARIELEIDSREVDQAADAEEEVDLDCPYLDSGILDVSRWASDAIALAFPTQPLCEEGCGGLCPACGERLAPGEPAHAHARAKDPRLSALDDIEFD